MSARPRTGPPPNKTRITRDAEATTCNHQEGGNAPREGRNPIQTALGLQSISVNKNTDDPTPLHAQVAGGTHFLQSCVCTRPVRREVTKLILEEDL